jgi:Thiolase, N-terminal domain
MPTHDVVVCSPVRTAIGAFNGSLKTIPATDLGATVVRETLKRSGLDAAAIGSVVMGNVIQAGNKMRPRLGPRGRRRLAIPLHPQARGTRAGGEGRIHRRNPLSSGGDVRTGRRISHHHPRTPAPAPIYPMFGRGRTRLQPAYVEDVAEAIARALQRTQTHAITFECGGPRVYSYEELLRALAREADLKRILIPLPFAAWRALAWTAELFPNPPVRRVPADGHDFWMAQYGRRGASGENQTEESASNGGNRPRPPIRRVPFV